MYVINREMGEKSIRKWGLQAHMEMRAPTQSNKDTEALVLADAVKIMDGGCV